MSGWRIRPGSAADLGLIPALEQDAAQLYRTVGYVFCADGPVRDEAEIRAALATGMVAVGETAAGEPCGFALALPVDGSAHLLELGVARAQQGRGVGRALVGEVAAWARGREFHELTLTTFRDVPWNGPAYARMGFVAFEPGHERPQLRAIVAEEAALGFAGRPRIAMRLSLVRLPRARTAT